MIYQSSSSRDTEQFAASLARRIVRLVRARTTPKASVRQGRATVVALSGELGGGKTTFARGFARGLGARGRVQSPTFIIIRRMQIGKQVTGGKRQAVRGKGQRFENLFHMDAYRISKKAELGALGLREVLRNPKNILLIEWPENLPASFRRGAFRVYFSHGANKNLRTIRVKMKNGE